MFRRIYGAGLRAPAGDTPVALRAPYVSPAK